MAKLPGFYERFFDNHPVVGEAHATLGEACKTAGPLSTREAELVKIGISVAAGLEGAAHSHVRRALEAGASPDEIKHAVILATTTVGFPRMMAGLAWAEDILGVEDS